MFKKRITPFACIISAIVACGVTFVGVHSYDSVKYKAELDEYRKTTAIVSDYKDLIASVGVNEQDKYTKLSQIIQMIEDNSIRDYDSQLLWDNIYRSLIISLGDDYGQYLTADEFNSLTDSADGEFVGIGVHAVRDIDTNGVYIFGVMPNSPAEKAGVKNGDIIVSVEGIDATEDNYYTMLDKIRGEEGSDVSFKILRGDERIDFKVTRADVASENVIYEKLSDNVAYIRMLSFADETVSEEFTRKIALAQNEGCDKFLFDVRNNSGGYLNEICDVLDILLPEGPIINIVDSKGNKKVQYSDANCINGKMAVLCNNSTASAAELFTAALMDYSLAQSVGTKTFGKGTMQTTSVLPDGSAIKVSTAFYNPPNNQSYDGVGINPNYEIQLPEKWEGKFYQMPKSEDTQLQKALELLKAE